MVASHFLTKPIPSTSPWSMPSPRISSPALLQRRRPSAHPPSTRRPARRRPRHREPGVRRAERRGLVTGEVGRGTFVRKRATRRRRRSTERERRPLPHRPHQKPAGPRAGRSDLRRAIETLPRRPDLDRLVDFYQPAAGMARHRAAGAAWVRRAGVETDARPRDRHQRRAARSRHGTGLPDRPGDVVLTEELTYTGIKAIASLLQLQLQPLAMDDDGVRPDAFAAACRERRAPRALLHAHAAESHRPYHAARATARDREIAERYDVALVEDDVYGFLPGLPCPPSPPSRPHAPTTSPAPRRAWRPASAWATSSRPRPRSSASPAIIRASTWLTAPLLAEVATALDRGWRGRRAGGMEAAGDRRAPRAGPSGAGAVAHGNGRRPAFTSGSPCPSRGAPRGSSRRRGRAV